MWNWIGIYDVILMKEKFYVEIRIYGLFLISKCICIYDVWNGGKGF